VLKRNTLFACTRYFCVKRKKSIKTSAYFQPRLISSLKVNLSFRQVKLQTNYFERDVEEMQGERREERGEREIREKGEGQR
jgi:hypothetical protein